MTYYIENFLLFSIIGYLYENILHLLTRGHLASNPFILCFMPIYGFGIVIMIFLTRLIFNRLKAPRIVKIICLFISVVIVLTLLEQLGGMIIEKVFHKSFWDYSKMKFHLGKYICLEVSLFWGISCLFFLYVIKPWTDKICKIVDNRISYSILVVFIIDFIYSFFIK